MKAVGGQKAFKIEGVAEMKKTLLGIRKTLNAEGNAALTEQLLDALLVPAQVMADEARDLVPVKTGKLRSAIFAAKGKGASAFAAVDLKIAPYAHFVEKGTSKTPANPYFRPAVAATRPTTARMLAERLPSILGDAAAQNAWKKAPK